MEHLRKYRFACSSNCLSILFILALLTFFSAVPAAAITLLSDRCISKIYGGQQVTIEVEDKTTVDIRIDHLYWGDANGFGKAANPGYIDIQFPYENFQYDTFQYQFATKEAADDFSEALADAENQTATINSTEIFYKAPNAQDIGLNDTTAREIDYVIVTTTSKVSDNFVLRNQGTIISQPIRFTLTFPDEDDPYRVTVETITYDAINDEFDVSSIDYGRFITEVDYTGNTPITVNNKILVPRETTYLKAVTATLELECPLYGFSIALIPEGDTPIPDAVFQYPGSPANYPDFAAAADTTNQLGKFALTDLKVHLSGGNPIYVFPNNYDFPNK